MPIVRRLDRYVFWEFSKLFLLTTICFPVLIIVSDLATNLEKYLDLKISPHDLALSYFYWIPDSTFMVLPAAVLFATVFSIGSFTRHAELTAAKASGTSFYRMTAPILVGAMLAFGLDVALGTVLPEANQRRSELLKERAGRADSRANFVFAGGSGEVYKAYELRNDGNIRGLQVERKGLGPNYPTYLLTSDAASYGPSTGRWTMRSGAMHIVVDDQRTLTIAFDGGWDNHFSLRPADMLSQQRDAHNLSYGELTRVIASTERSGGNANLLRVERALKIAIPVTCVIIALFGAPLATSTQRGGSAYGVAVSLATTMIFLLAIQLTRAIGGQGSIPPDLAAFMPCAAFGVLGLVLLARVRT